ncbi:methyl-accepting chemotaxis protein [Natronoglomus mannanivorans]|uniref:Methyl-accepting chemotaxis protein n=1 Tax=Natronoglomus mannanivorans TaxID=2979990 RepID=A0AAP2Z0U4_9EURY|nr:methyl-accepting chemotaxis protein [Halobacteria archaeon AArc-xg1-1]
MKRLLRKLTPRAIRRSYALKFAIALLVLGASVGAVGIVGTMQIQSEVESNVHDEHATLAKQEAQSLYAWNGHNEETVEALSRTDAVQSGDVDRIQAFIEGEMRDREETERSSAQLHYISDDGTVLASSKTDVDRNPVSTLEGEWIDELDQHSGTSVTDAYRSGELGGEQPRIAYVTDRFLDGDAVLAYTVPATRYSSQLGGGDSGVTMVVDDRNRVLFEETSGVLFETYDEENDATENAFALESGRSDSLHAGPASGILTSTTGYGIGEGEYVVGYAPVTGTEWAVLVHTPAEDAYGFVQDVQQYGLYASIAGVLLVGVVGAVIGRNTSRSIDRLTTKAARMEDGDLEVDLSSPRIDSIGRLYDGFATMRDSLKSQITAAEEARADAERARAETERLNEHLEEKADEYADVMRAAGEGDFTARMDAESDNEAMAAIATTFNETIGEIERTTARLNAFANEVATASEQVTASAEEVRGASEQVSASIQEISDGADRQNDSLQSVTHEMDGLSTTIEQIAASSNEVADIAERTAETGKAGREAAQTAIEGMTELEAESDEAVAEIERLEDEVEQIDELIDFISSVAEQTNMLALNANIEAARTESADDGFAAVAGEVKSLAQETKEAAEDIEERLTSIQRQTERTAEEVQSTSRRVAEHTDSVAHAVDALDEIAEYAAETNDGVQEISAASEQQAASTQEVVAMVDQAATISEETSAESETVAAAAEEQTVALTEVSRSASSLTTQASELSTALDEFETNVEIRVDVDVDVETESALPSENALASNDGETLSYDSTGDSDMTSKRGSDDERVAGPDQRTE